MLPLVGWRKAKVPPSEQTIVLAGRILSDDAQTLDGDKLQLNEEVTLTLTRRGSGTQQLAQRPGPRDDIRGEGILSAGINRLTSNNLTKMVQIIKKNIPRADPGSEEIEVDINALDNRTLWKLHTFLNERPRGCDGDPAGGAGFVLPRGHCRGCGGRGSRADRRREQTRR